MERANRSALKEWAAVERILAAGSSVLLLRKGGIRERRDGFEVEHREFWLFPTHFHQNPHELAAGFGWALEPGRQTLPDPNRVRLEHYAVVTDAFRVESLPVLDRLSGLHPLTDETVHSRFAYRDRPYLHALVLRLHRLSPPHQVPNTLDYEGCISWVALDDELSSEGAVPVIEEEEFQARRREVLALLDVPGASRI